jgi:hypothetical protein
LTGIACETEDAAAGPSAVVFMGERLQEMASAFAELLEARRASR